MYFYDFEDENQYYGDNTDYYGRICFRDDDDDYDEEDDTW